MRLFTGCISSCSGRSQWLEALRLFRRMEEPDGIAFGAAIASCEKSSMWTMALKLLEEMQGRRQRVEGVKTW